MSSTLKEKKELFLSAHMIYHSGHGAMSPLTDDQYDELKRELLQLAPDWKPLYKAGWAPNLFSPLEKGKHVGFMGSIYNAYDYAGAPYKDADATEKWFRGFERWMKSHEQQVIATLKVDGLSVAIEYKDGIIKTAMTRGDCETGENVTHHLLVMPNVPRLISSSLHLVVRGEVVMFTADWMKFREENPDYTAARNAAAGIMGRKDVKNTKWLRFVAHDVQVLDELPDAVGRGFFKNMLDAVAEDGFLIPPYKVCDDVPAAALFYEEVKQKRNVHNLCYEIDGVVYRINDQAVYKAYGVDRDRCPRGAVAWKFPAQTAVTKLLGVDLTVGHTGAIAPTAVLQPVIVGGVTVGRASLANFDEIDRLGIGINDDVEISRQGDVIPKVIRMVKGGGLERKAITRPTQCPVCGGETSRKVKVGGDSGAHIFCINPDCPAQSTGKIKKWISSTGIMEVGDSIVNAMVEHKLVEDPADLYLLTSTELAEMPFGKSTFGVKRAGKVVKNISEKRSLPLNVFLGALGVTGLGEGVARNVREKMPGRFDKLENWIGCTKLIDFAEKVSLPNTARGIYEGLSAKAGLVQKLLSVGVTIAEPKAPAVPAGTGGYSICLTGAMNRPRKEWEEMIRQAGHNVASDVSSTTTHLCQADPTSQSSKSKKAAKLGIPVISEADLLQMLTSPASSSAPNTPSHPDTTTEAPAVPIGSPLEGAMPDQNDDEVY